MKTFLISLMFVTLSAAAIHAQQAEPLKIYVENLYDSQRIVKNAPFSAEAASENIQVLADGNRIVRRSSSKIFRDSEGRYRREDMPKTLGVGGVDVSVPQSIVILDPVQGFVYMLNPQTNTARKSLYKRALVYSVKPEMDAKFKFQLETLKAYTVEQQAALENAKAKAERDAQEADKAAQNSTTMDPERAKEIAARQAERTKQAAERQLERTKAIAARQAGMESRVSARTAVTVGVPYSQAANFETKTESLGVQNINGVQAEGTRSTTTIPANAIGNERPIDIVYEKWYSKDLQMIVMSKHDDPRNGEQVYRLTDIRLGEPRSDIFSPGPEYKIVEASTPKATTVIAPKPAAMVKPAPTSPAPAVTVSTPPRKPNEQ